MKIKGPIQVKGLYFYGKNTEVDITISTPALIEELGKRRPCEKCVDSFMEKRSGCMCVWQDPFYYDKDNFKEAK